MLERENNYQKADSDQKGRVLKTDRKTIAEISKINSNTSLPKLFLDSASTLVHTSGPSHMFPKQKRFNFGSQFDESINRSSISKIESQTKNRQLMNQSTLSQIKYTIPTEKRDVFKNQLTRHIDTNMKLVPGSNNYQQLSQLVQSSSNIYCNGKFQGRSFANNRSKYDKLYLPQAHDGVVKRYDEFTMRHSVGPGRYKTQREIGYDKPQITISMKKEIDYDNRVPGSTRYNPNFSQVLMNKHSHVNITSSKKIDMGRPNNNYPGPADYIIKSCFDKYARK